MLEDLLRQRRIEGWRRATAASARKAVKDFHAGKLKSQSADAVIARLRAGLNANAGFGLAPSFAKVRRPAMRA